MPKLDAREAPPPDYYAANLRHVLGAVRARDRDLLNVGELDFIDGFLGAGSDAQRLFARLLSRKGPWLRVDSLNYAEVADTEAALCELESRGLVQRNGPIPADALAQLLTRAELAERFPAVHAPGKPAWILACVGRYPDALIRARIARRFGWVTVSAFGAFQVCRILYFGDARHDLSSFVVEDLGIVAFERYELGARTRPFAARAELDEYLSLLGMAALSHRLDAHPQLADALLRRLWQPASTRIGQRQRNRTLNRLGYWHQRRGEFDEALTAYALSDMHPARQRRLRLLTRLQDARGAAALAEAMARAPRCAEEEDLAARSRGRRRFEVPTEVRALAGARPQSIEQHALSCLVTDGGRGWHSENRFPLGLAGLLFWEQIFAPVRGAFTHRFQSAPRDLFWPDFAAARRAPLAAQVAALARPGAVAGQLRRTLEQKSGLASQLVSWSLWQPEFVELLLAQVPEERLLTLGRTVIHDLPRLRNGFPDLLVLNGPGRVELVEVKAPTDQLQGAQRVWLALLPELGWPARLLKFRP
ncbi:MAG: VRR-NUC domain-containing protein [Pseudomonadales bacterium]